MVNKIIKVTSTTACYLAMLFIILLVITIAVSILGIAAYGAINIWHGVIGLF